MIGLCAGLGYSLYSIFGKVLVGKYESLTVTVYTFLIAAAATLLISRPAEMVEKVAGNLSAFPLIFLGSFVTVGLPYLIYSVALKHIESSRASIIASFEVVAASLFGVVLYGETLSGMNLAGILLVVTAPDTCCSSRRRRNAQIQRICRNKRFMLDFCHVLC